MSNVEPIVGADAPQPVMTAAEAAAIMSQQGGGQQTVAGVPVGAPAPVAPAPNAPAQFLTPEQAAEQVAAARREEKDKLYGRVQELDAEVKKLREAREAEEAAAQQALEEKQAAEAAAEREKLTLTERLTQTVDQFDLKFKTLEQEREQERITFQKEREYQELQAYGSRRLAEERENIMPELLDLVSGDTQEEIEASIEGMKARTAAIVAQVQQQTQAVAPPTPWAPQGTAVSAPPVGPLEQESSYQTITPQQIAAMPMNEYKQYRERLLAAASPARG